MRSIGLLLVVSGPSGAGKGTICKELIKRYPNFHYSVSATTRLPRVGEVDGEHYFFVSKENFEEMIANNQLLEWAKVYDNYYGTPVTAVTNGLEQGEIIILEIDIQGAKQVKEKFPEGVFVFVAPPSLTELRRRITQRGTDAPEVIEKRMSCTKEELSHVHEYNYVILNDTVDNAVQTLEAIIMAEQARPKYFSYEII